MGAPTSSRRYFPYVELSSPEMPWRFSPFGAERTLLTSPDPNHDPETQVRLRPWLALVVVPAEQATLTPAAPGGLPTLSTDAGRLPNAAEAWAWAYVQVVGVDAGTPGEGLTDPARCTGRLLCPCRLAPQTRYLACVVPTFAAGVSAPEPTSPGVDPLAPAWGRTGPVRLPVYFQWSFTTAQSGSFEALAGSLTPRRPEDLPGVLTGRVVAVDAPGWGASGTAGATVVMHGALRPVQSDATDATDPALARSLRDAVSSSGIGAQLRPPLYGQDYQHGVTAVPTEPGWLRDLNIDPRHRIAAGLAAWAVAVEQEDLADRAWQQLAGRQLSQSATSRALAELVGGVLADRHQPAGAPAALLRMLRTGGPLSGSGSAAAGRASERPASAAPTRAPRSSADADVAPPPAPDSGLSTPRFPEPAYPLLRVVAEDWLLPGAAGIPQDTVMLLRSNPEFVEAFMVGLNHALARELVWRRYPLEPASTMFNTFWAGQGDAASSLFPPLDEWPADSALGSHTGTADQLVLLLRGALLRRFPTAAVYLALVASDGAETHVTPSLHGTVGADIAFFGFPTTAEAVLAPPAEHAWFAVIQESAHHARFGLDDPPASGTTATLDSWQDIDWAHPHLTDPITHAPLSHVPVEGPLLGLSRRISEDSDATATWGLSSGHLAVALQQPAFQVRIPAALWLQPLASDPIQ